RIYFNPKQCPNLAFAPRDPQAFDITGINKDCDRHDNHHFCSVEYYRPQLGRKYYASTAGAAYYKRWFVSTGTAWARVTGMHTALQSALEAKFDGECRELGGIPCRDQVFSFTTFEPGCTTCRDRYAMASSPSAAPTGFDRLDEWATWGCVM